MSPENEQDGDRTIMSLNLSVSSPLLRLYGTSRAAAQAVLDTGRVCVLDIDVQGARLLRQSQIGAIFVFVAPPSLEVRSWVLTEYKSPLNLCAPVFSMCSRRKQENWSCAGHS